MKKAKDLGIIALIYILAYVIGILSCRAVESLILKCFIFDTVATVVVFLFSVILVNSSVYDAYWSLTPMMMSLCLFIGSKAFSLWQILFLIVFNIWSLRLTANWTIVFTDFSYEDWRYRKFRNETPRALWPAVNFFGIHYVPTLVVFLGMLPLFRLIENPLGVLALPGVIVMLFGIGLETFADRAMHAFLASERHGDVCQTGLWKYSRHPNYLGEITVWTGVFLVMLPYSPAYWYYAIGFVSVAVMFNVISVPLMEKRQLERRPGYAEYAERTSRLLLLPVKG